MSDKQHSFGLEVVYELWVNLQEREREKSSFSPNWSLCTLFSVIGVCSTVLCNICSYTEEIHYGASCDTAR